MKDLPQSKTELRKLLQLVQRALTEDERPAKGAQVGTRPVRAHVLDVLDDLQWPAHTREIAKYAAARYGRDIPPTRFGTLASDEIKSFLAQRRPRAVWLGFALTYDRAEPIKRLWTRSDWPLEWRIVAPTSGRVQFLKMAARLCELAATESASDPEMMRIIAADYARDLPGVQFKRGSFDLNGWRELALESLIKLEPRDEEIRVEAAARWAPRLTGSKLLFGMPEVIDNDVVIPLSKRGSA